MTPARKDIASFGRKGARDYVRVFREPVAGRSMIRVQWWEGTGDRRRRRTESFHDTRVGLAEAKAFATGRHEALGMGTGSIPAMSVRELFEHYLTAKDGLKPNTVRLAKERWGAFELFIGKDAPAALVTRERLDQLKKQLLALGRAPNQVKLVLEEVRRIYLWAVDRDLIPPSKVATYRVQLTRAVRQRGPKMEEFKAGERTALVAQCDPRHARQWRPFVLLTILAYCGPRVSAALALELDDLDLEARRIHWRAETDKTSRERWQPMPEPVFEAICVALGWRQFDRYEGRFLLYGVQRRTRGFAPRVDRHHARQRFTMDSVTVHEKPWTYQAAIAQLHAAEARAGLTPTKWKGAHAFRRGVAGDVRTLTGSDKLAADWIGDRSVRVVQQAYLLERDEELRDIAARIAPESETAKRHEMQSAPESTPEPKSQVTDNLSLGEEPAVGIEPTTA